LVPHAGGLNGGFGGGVFISVPTPHAAHPPPPPPPPSLLAGLRSFDIPFSVGQAEEAVANLPLRLAVRVHCGR
jgi:hypothetical protein